MISNFFRIATCYIKKKISIVYYIKLRQVY